MGTMIKYKRLNEDFVKKNYPILYTTIDDLFKNKVNTDCVSTKEAREYLAGLCLEIALKSDGTPAMFEDDIDDDFFVDEEDEY